MLEETETGNKKMGDRKVRKAEDRNIKRKYRWKKGERIKEEMN